MTEKINYIKKMLSFINTLKLERYTGIILFKLVFNQGGIRDLKKRTETEENI